MPGGAAGGTGAVGAGRAAVASHGYGSPSLDTWLRTSLHFRTTRGNSLQLDATTLARPKHTTQLLADTAVPFFRLPPAPRRRTARVQLESPSHRTHSSLTFHLVSYTRNLSFKITIDQNKEEKISSGLGIEKR